MARNPYTRRTNRDIYNEELKKLEKLQVRAAKYGIQDSYKPSKAKRIRQEQIKGLQTHGINLKREIQKAQTRERNERRRQQWHEEAVERREQRKAQTADKNERIRQQKHEEAVGRREQRKAATRDKNERLKQQAREATAEKRKKAKERRELQKEFDKEARENEKIDKAQYRAQKKALEKQAKEAEKKRISAERKCARMDRANARAREKRTQDRLLKELQTKFGTTDLPYNEADRLPDTDILPFGVLAEQRFMHYLHELDHAISLLKMSRRYDETALMEFRDLLTEWYQEDPAEVTQKLLESLESDGISDYNYFYNLVETGQIATVIYKAQAEHERFKDIYISEKFGILEDED